jgi:hypothetical protein
VTAYDCSMLKPGCRNVPCATPRPRGFHAPRRLHIGPSMRASTHGPNQPAAVGDRTGLQSARTDLCRL